VGETSGGSSPVFRKTSKSRRSCAAPEAKPDRLTDVHGSVVKQILA
jgi:hypothetical protein